MSYRRVYHTVRLRGHILGEAAVYLVHEVPKQRSQVSRQGAADDGNWRCCVMSGTHVTIPE